MTKLFSVLALMMFLSVPSYAVDWGINDYETYEPGFYDDTSSDLYSADDDWYYDNYTIGAEEEEEGVLEDDSYDWESEGLFETEV